jgi:DICT domain-containing protein
MYINVAVHYVRPKQVAYVREALQAVIREVIDEDELDLETDPVVVRAYRFIEKRTNLKCFLRADLSISHQRRRNAVRANELQTKRYLVPPSRN